MMDGYSERQLRKLVYVGITGARHRLFAPHVTEAEIIGELRRRLWGRPSRTPPEIVTSLLI